MFGRAVIASDWTERRLEPDTRTPDFAMPSMTLHPNAEQFGHARCVAPEDSLYTQYSVDAWDHRWSGVSST